MHLSEKSIMFRLGIYLEKYIKEDDDLKKYHLDSEYNRNVDKVKCITNDNDEEKNIYPDLIIHERGSKENNLIVIELKMYWNEKGVENDYIKLKKLTDPKGDFCYKYGLSIIIKEGCAIPKWFVNAAIKEEIIGKI